MFGMFDMFSIRFSYLFGFHIYLDIDFSFGRI